jgi:hypothetical protein
VIVKPAGPGEALPPAPPDAADAPPVDDLATQVTAESAQAMFRAVAGQGEPDTSDDPTIQRARWVEVDPDGLVGVPGPPGSGLGGARFLRLTLFDDVVLIALLDREWARPPDGVTWIGHIEGVPGSRVILRVEGEPMSGDISLHEASYQVQHAGDEVHVIYQVELSAAPSH